MMKTMSEKHNRIIVPHILLACGNHLHDHIISLRGEGWIYKTNLTPPLSIEVTVSTQESERSCICMLKVSIFASFYDYDI
jgi:hypothetical protein